MLRFPTKDDESASHPTARVKLPKHACPKKDDEVDEDEEEDDKEKIDEGEDEGEGKLRRVE